MVTSVTLSTKFATKQSTHLRSLRMIRTTYSAAIQTLHGIKTKMEIKNLLIESRASGDYPVSRKSWKWMSIWKTSRKLTCPQI